jgi:hypothetical protein
MKTLIARGSRGLGLLLLSTLAVFSAVAADAATIDIQNNNAAGVGFNDPTPRAPVGGNPGVTLGAQRLYIFQYAADIWSRVLPSSVTIVVRAQFAAQTCTATSAILGSAGSSTIHANFAGAPFANTWYNQALANKLFGADLSANPDINATFNLNIDSGCFGPGQVWYYGVDGLEGPNIELLPVVLHEIGHGLGFQTFTSGSTGAYNGGAFPSIADRFLYDSVNNLHWSENTAAQRVASAISIDKLAWDGAAVNKEAMTYLGPRPVLVINSPGAIAGTYAVQTATFGAALTLAGASGNVVLADDGVAPNSDGCSPLVNGGAILGNFALIDRGTCTFVAKALAAQAAGATGLIVANNVAAGLPGMGGTDPSITIPCVGISQADGNAIKANLAGGVNVTMILDPSQKAGADNNGRTLMYAPNPFASGSSVSHFDISLSPNALMEPAANADLHDNLDLTPLMFRDLGWFQPATLTLTASPEKGTCEEKVLLTATVSPAGEAKGVIEFFDGANSIGVADVINNTTATLSLTSLAMGTHALTARHTCYTCSTTVVSPVLNYEINCPTPALLSLFRAEPLVSGVELRWQFGDAGRFVDSWIERAARAEGPWATLAADRRLEGGMTVAMDRTAVAGTEYWYRLVARQQTGATTLFGPLRATAGSLVARSELGAVRPNPGKGNFTVDFSVPRQSNVRVSVLDVQGREVALLFSGPHGPGLYQAVWTGETAKGLAPVGMYFVRYQAPDKVLFSRLVLAR